MSIIDELKRRKIIRVTLAYGVVSWILIQIGEATFEALRLPEWALTFMIVMLLAGFPIVIVFAWVFDRTSEGFVKTPSQVASGESTAGGTVLSEVQSRSPFYAKKRFIFASMALAAGVGIGFILQPPSEMKNTDEKKSIAVLPFSNLSDSREDEYFSDGITEDIISHLSKIEELRVIARTSILQYKGTTMNVLEIAKELGVNTILEGSVRRSGDQVRIVGQLIDVRTDDHLWSDTYDRSMSNIFAVQTDVARSIAAALETELAPQAKESIASVPTTSIEAYNLLLKGKQEYYKYTSDGFRNSIDYFQQAIKLDPFYATAYAELGNSYGQLFLWTEKESYSELGFSAIDKALSINSELAEAYKAKALLLGFNGQGSESLKNDLKAIKLKPGYHDAIGNVGFRYRNVGDYSESLEWYLKMARGDPYHRYTAMHLSSAYFLLEEMETSIKILEEGLERIPDSFECIRLLVNLYNFRGDRERSKKHLDLLFERRPDDNRKYWVATDYYYYIGDLNRALQNWKQLESPSTNQKLDGAAIYHLLGNSKNRDALLTETEMWYSKWKDKAPEDWFSMVGLAAIAAMRGETSLALDNMQEAFSLGYPWHWGWENNPIFFEVRSTERYRTLVEKIKRHVQRERIEAGFVS